jgi:hypothetical protein
MRQPNGYAHQQQQQQYYGNAQGYMINRSQSAVYGKRDMGRPDSAQGMRSALLEEFRTSKSKRFELRVRSMLS